MQHCENLCPSKRKVKTFLRLCVDMNFGIQKGLFFFIRFYKIQNSLIIQTTQVQSTSVMDNEASYLGCWHLSHLRWILVSVLKDYWEAAMHVFPPKQHHISLSPRPKGIEICAGTAVLHFVWNSSTNNNYMKSTVLQEQELDLVHDLSVPTKCDQRGCWKFSLSDIF